MTREPRGPVRPDTASALLDRVARAQVEGRVPSLSVGLVRDGALAWSAGRGLVDGAPPTTDTQYRIGSVTKGLTAVLVLRLRDEGRLDLDDPLEEHLPGTALGDRTVRELLAHAAGLAAEPPGEWWERAPGRPWEELAPTLPAEGATGMRGRFHYSNPGYALLGRLVAAARGRPWYAVLRDEVLRPLGMTRTTYDAAAPHAPGLAVHPYADVVMPEVVQDLGAMAPAGQLWSTVADLARWAAFLAGDTGDVLAPDTLAEMRRPHVIADDAEWQSGYGLGFQVLRVGGRRLVGHGGSVPGYLASVLVDVERRTGAVELANGTSGAGALCGSELLGLLQDREPHVVDAWQPVADLGPGLLDLVGLWHWGPSPFLLRLRGTDRLDLRPVSGRGRAASFGRTTDGGWTGLDGYWAGEPLRARYRPDGSLSHLDLGTFVLTREPYGPSDAIPGGVADDPWGA